MTPADDWDGMYHTSELRKARDPKEAPFGYVNVKFYPQLPFESNEAYAKRLASK